MQCSCVILNFRDSERTIALARILSSYEAVARVVVVDNCSPDDSWEKLQELSGIERIILIKSDHNNGYGAGNNIGLRYCLDNPLDESRQLVMLCNPDTMISEAAVKETITCFIEHPLAVVCAPWEYDLNTGEAYPTTAWLVPTDTTYIMQFLAILGRIVKIPEYTADELTDRFAQVGCLSGALIMLDVEHYETLGLYDEEIFLLCEETSLGLRAQGKYESYLCTKERYTHEFSTSIRTSLPNYRKRVGILSRSRRHVLLAHYKVHGVKKAMTHLCYGISLVEAFPLSWAYKALCWYREKK